MQPNILLAYNHYPYSIGYLYKRGFEQLGIRVASLGHSTGSRIPWNGGIDLPADTPDIQLPEMKGVYEDYEWTHLVQPGSVDFFINVDAAHHFKGRPVGSKKIIVGTDPHAVSGYVGRREDCDLFVNMQRCYAQKGDYWIPYAYDEEWHIPPKPFVQLKDRQVDVMFVGGLYKNRAMDLNYLMMNGLNCEHHIGPIGLDYTKLYWNAKIAYCTPSMNDLPARFFEALAIGIPPVTRWVPDLDTLGLKKFVHYIPAKSQDDMLEGVRRVIGDEELWLTMSMEGRAWVGKHSWSARAQQLLQLYHCLVNSQPPETDLGWRVVER